MRAVRFDPSQLEGADREWWDAWAVKANAALEKVVSDVEAGNAPRFRDDVWGELKRFLLEKVFYGKCAYCESFVDAVTTADAEHYRPKGKVTTKVNGKDVDVSTNGLPHPGYYWLAYNWRNLLPACSKCNSNKGKRTQFPVQGEYVSHHHGADDVEVLNQREDPLLLHPYYHNPARELVFGIRGVVAARASSVRAQPSIDAYDLGRSSLMTERDRSQTAAWNAYVAAMFGSPDQAQDALSGFYAGREPHSTAVLQWVTQRFGILEEKFHAAEGGAGD